MSTHFTVLLTGEAARRTDSAHQVANHAFSNAHDLYVIGGRSREAAWADLTGYCALSAFTLSGAVEVLRRLSKRSTNRPATLIIDGLDLHHGPYPVIAGLEDVLGSARELQITGYQLLLTVLTREVASVAIVVDDDPRTVSPQVFAHVDGVIEHDEISTHVTAA